MAWTSPAGVPIAIPQDVLDVLRRIFGDGNAEVAGMLSLGRFSRFVLAPSSTREVPADLLALECGEVVAVKVAVGIGPFAAADLLVVRAGLGHAGQELRLREVLRIRRHKNLLRGV
jgi:hypothetical protein